LKENNFVIAEPDILTFDLSELKPRFIILATDGLWDAFSNEEAVQFIKERLHEPHYGAKSIVLQAFYRGSLDNITVMIVNLEAKKIVKISSQDEAPKVVKEA
jgi:protein phosphatase 1L